MENDKMIPNEKPQEGKAPVTLTPEQVQKIKQMDSDKQKKLSDSQTIHK